MKVVIFCGGLGMRLRTERDAAPKPMVRIGDRPVLWHVMRYYAHFGHTDFILCLGYGASAVKQYFLEYQETESNDFVLHGAGGRIDLLNSDIRDWRITFVDTGIDTAIGERLRRVRPLLEGEEVFLANYGDVLTDAPLDEMTRTFHAAGVTASLLAVKPQASFHIVHTAPDGLVSSLQPVSDLPLRENGGYFILHRSIFEVLHAGEDLVGDAFPRLADAGRLLAIPHDGFWAPMDTRKEQHYLDELHKSGCSPWQLWARLPEPTAPPVMPGLPQLAEAAL